MLSKETSLVGGRGVLFVPWALLDPPKRFLIDLSTSSKISIFEHFQKSTKMVSQSDLFGSWPLLVPQKVKMDPNMGPQSDICGPQNGHNATCCQSSSKHNFSLYSSDNLLYLILNKLYVRCFCVLRSIKSDLRFDLHLEMDKKASWRRQEAEKVPTETFLDDFGPQVEIKRGPTSTLRATKIGQEAPKGRCPERGGRSPERVAAS